MMIGRRTLVGALVSVGPVGPAICQQGGKVRVRQWGAGTVMRDAEGKTISESSTTVMAKLKVGFFIVIGVGITPDNAPVTLTQVTRFPSIGGTKGNAVVDMTERSDFKANPGTLVTRMFVFTKDWQLQAGEWALEIWHGDDKLLAQPFTVHLEKEPKKGN